MRPRKRLRAMENNQNKNYLTNDLKLQAFLRLMLPDSFVGVNKSNPARVSFVFKQSPELGKYVEGYLAGKQFLMSPSSFATNIEQGKSMIYGDY